MRHLPTFAFALMASAAFAQGEPPQLTADAAKAMISGCETHSRSKGQSHAIAVTDDGGHLVAAVRMTGNSQGVMEFALAKARAAAAWGFGTAQMERAASATPGFAAAPGVVTVPGGLPVFSSDGQHRIGAIGVSGEAPADDVACAQAGIQFAGLRWEREAR